MFAVFRMAGQPQRVDCLVLRRETALSVFPKDTATCYRIGSRNSPTINIMWQFKICKQTSKRFWWTFQLQQTSTLLIAGRTL